MPFIIHLAASRARDEREVLEEFPALVCAFVEHEYQQLPSFDAVFHGKANIVTKTTFPFPPVGRVTSHPVELWLSHSSWVLTLFTRLLVPGASEEVGFSAGPIGNGDTLGILAQGPRVITGNLLHEIAQVGEACVVRCADGRSSQSCVTCRHKNVVVRICC